MRWLNYLNHLRTASTTTLAVISLAALGTISGSLILIGTASAGTDRSAPSVSIAFPIANGAHKGSTWNNGCGTAGVCGTASDPAGVARVEVAVRQVSTGKYWNGTSFSSSAQQYVLANGTTSWLLPLIASPPLPDGSYSMFVRSADNLGNAASASQASRNFNIDNVTPPTPVITKKPDNPSSQRNAQFQFSTAEAGAGFRCSLDGGAFSPCNSGVTYQQLETNDHCFAVYAIDAAGNTSGDTDYCWTLLVSGAFRITGDVAGNLAPGVSLPMDLTIQNPFNFDIKLVAVSVGIGAATTAAGAPNPNCIAGDNVFVAEPYTGAAVIPRNSTASLSQLGVDAAQWPHVAMRDLTTNQDGCKNATFAFTFTGSATKP